MSLTNGKGEYEYGKNPLSVPKKGSDLPMRNKGGNSDRASVMKQMSQVKPTESLRGKMG